ncbi:MAG: AbrB/MazE/SpoVT family DNA-binding domain-containing protein [Defluviitaleaceae bacterium]|nr:AbrB/MazE/SpoVT family DNA-binding domain-containing protein [Defluviitaleaceae bacterium]
MLAREPIYETLNLQVPKDFVEKAGLVDGGTLNVYEEDGIFYIMPASVYSQAYLDALHEEFEEMKKGVANGTQPVYRSMNDLIAALEEDDDD